jgi:hypothetical protein
MTFLRRTLIASAAFAMLAAAPALAVDYGRWFFSTANDPKPLPFSECVTRAQAAMASQGFGARVGGTNPAYLDATSGLVSVTAFCIGQPKGFYYILVVASDDGSKSALHVGNAINAAFFGSDTSIGSGGAAATGAGGTWQLTSTCGFTGSGWQSTLDLTQAAGGALTGMVRNDPLTPVVVGGQFTGTTMTLTLRPADWADNMQLTGELSGGKIAGKVHHLGGDDCTFSMVRTASSSA